MIGSVEDFIRRMCQVLPVGWFADTNTFINAVLSGLAAAWAGIYLLLTTVRDQARIATATGSFLDLISIDFFAASLPRWPDESDAGFLRRIQNEMLRPRGTRAALIQALTQLTGTIPSIFEPVRPRDTGSYNAGGAAYNYAGGWGNLASRNMSFVTVWRPTGQGIANLAGYDTGGALAYGSLAMVASPVSDSAIAREVTAIIPTGHISWLRILG